MAERPRRRAVPLPPLEHPGRHVAPYALEPGVSAAIAAHYGPERGARVVRALAAELDSIRRDAYAGRPVEAGRALRTLPLRPLADTPVGYFRRLFDDACGGDLLCDADDDAARVRDAEAAAALEHDGPIDRDEDDELDAEPVGPPDPRVAKARGLRDRLDLIGPAHPHADRYRAELEQLERELAARPPPKVRRVRVAPRIIRENVQRMELGPPTGRVVDIGGGLRAVVSLPDPRREGEAAERELRERWAALDFEALDRDTGPPPEKPP